MPAGELAGGSDGTKSRLVLFAVLVVLLVAVLWWMPRSRGRKSSKRAERPENDDSDSDEEPDQVPNAADRGADDFVPKSADRGADRGAIAAPEGPTCEGGLCRPRAASHSEDYALPDEQSADALLWREYMEGESGAQPITRVPETPMHMTRGGRPPGPPQRLPPSRVNQSDMGVVGGFFPGE